jgi:hypothetical protein
MVEIKSHQDIIALWPSRAALAGDLARWGGNRKKPNVRDWHQRNRIPTNWFDSVLEAAKQRGFDEVTYRVLSELY